MIGACIVYTLFYSILSIYFIFKDKRAKKKDLLLFLLFLLSLLFISASCIPSKTDDLYRHYKAISLIREWKLELTDTFTIFSGQFLPVWGISLYYLSRLSHYFWLVVLYTGITFTSLIVIMMQFRNINLQKSELSIFLFLFFALNSLSNINSGLRNECVFGVGTLLIFLYLMEKVRFVFLIPLYMILGFIHPAVYIIPVCCLISRYIKGCKWILLLWAPLMSYLILPVLNRIVMGIPYLTKLIEKLNYYFYERKYEMDYRLFIAIFILLAIMLYINIVIQNHHLFDNTFYQKYKLFYTLMIIITIGSAGTNLFLRFSYIIAWFSLPSIILLKRNCRVNRQFLLSGIVIVSFLLNIYNVVTLITFRKFGLI